MGSFDKTKKAIGVDKIDEKARKEMFEKFQSAGGKVLKEKVEENPSSKSSSSKSSPKTRPSTKPGNYSDSGSRSGSGSGGEGGDQAKSLNTIPDAEMGNFLNKMIIKFKCWANNVTPFGTSVLLPQFLSELNLEFKGALMEFKMASNELLANPDLSPKITKSLDKLSPLFVELIGRAGKVYDPAEITDLFEEYSSNPDAPVNIRRIAAPVYSIFRKLYYLYSYQATYKKAISAAYDAMQRLENKPQMIYNTKKKNTLNAVSLVFDRFFEKLYLVVIRNENKNIPMVSLYMENLLGIREEERPGQRKVGEDLIFNDNPNPEESNTEAEETSEESETKTETDERSPELILGDKLMSDTSLEELRKKHDPRNELSEIPLIDKCFITYLFFKEFDYEYSMIMTTKKISIQPTNIGGNKIDNKLKLLSIYELSRSCMDQFKIYVDHFKEYNKVKSNPGTNYIEYSKKLTQLEQRRGQQSRTSRATIRDYIEKACEAFELLLNDMRGEKQIVANLDEVLSFDSVETKKKLNRKAVKEAIMEAYCYTLSFVNKLNDGGDLFGGIVELTPEQIEKIFGKSLSIGTRASTNDAEESPLS